MICHSYILLLSDPGWSLLFGTLLLVLLAGIFWPKIGLLAFSRRSRLNRQRVWLEDALKYLFDCEYKKVTCSLNSIAGNLHISADKTAKLLNRLRSMGLITMEGEAELQLTDAGRSYALRIIRVHRIWERYLADETGVDQMEWHGEADLQEHQLSPSAANQLAARMGNPVFDPHGDPIPTIEGEMPQHRGQPLSSLEEGTVAQIIHLEDEPHTIYEQLAALGLYPGMQVYVMDKTDGKITFAADGEECILTTLFAASITVETLKTKEKIREKQELLSSLVLGESAEIISLSPNIRGQQRRRLMDLGFVPGTAIRAELNSAGGDPRGYRILGTTVGIRRQQADLIYIKRTTTNKHE
ncbi:MAG: metal-dependent transcriptional regulator [Saprospiraceae bacterium]